ncbi:MAG: Hpt domain-containing protein [Thermodesulfobacteriota bacterium]
MPEKRYTKKEVVYVDPDFMDLIPFFLESRHKDIVNIRECVAKADLKEAQRLGHGMKGAGGGYGFQEISRIGKSIEDAAKSGDTGEIENALDMLAEYLSVVEVLPGKSEMLD